MRRPMKIMKEKKEKMTMRRRKMKKKVKQCLKLVTVMEKVEKDALSV
jgi:hypothetical protein